MGRRREASPATTKELRAEVELRAEADLRAGAGESPAVAAGRMLRLGVDDEGNPHWQALEQERHENDFGGFRGFHGIVRAGDYGGDREHTVVGESADFRFEVAGDHIAKLTEGVAGRGMIGSSGFAKHERGKSGRGSLGTAQ